MLYLTQLILRPDAESVSVRFYIAYPSSTPQGMQTRLYSSVSEAVADASNWTLGIDPRYGVDVSA